MYLWYFCCFQVEDAMRYALLFLYMQKMAYEMRISDWSSDGCSSDLNGDEYSGDVLKAAIKDNAHPELADLVDHPAARAVARYSGALGVPLTVAGPLIRAMGDRLGQIVERQDRKSTRLNSSH